MWSTRCGVPDVEYQMYHDCFYLLEYQMWSTRCGVPDVEYQMYHDCFYLLACQVRVTRRRLLRSLLLCSWDGFVWKCSCFMHTFSLIGSCFVYVY